MGLVEQLNFSELLFQAEETHTQGKFAIVSIVPLEHVDDEVRLDLIVEDAVEHAKLSIVAFFLTSTGQVALETFDHETSLVPHHCVALAAKDEAAGAFRS